MTDTKKSRCEHCKGDIAIRNPSGFCDHLHYPEYCDVCAKSTPASTVPESWEKRFLSNFSFDTMSAEHRSAVIVFFRATLQEAIREREREVRIIYEVAFRKTLERG